MSHQIWENQIEVKVPRNRKRRLKRRKEVEKDQDLKQRFQAGEITKEIKEDHKKIINLAQNPKESTQILRPPKGLRDHLLAEVHPQARIRPKVKIAKIRTTKVFQERKWKVLTILCIQIVLSINQPLIIEPTDMTKKREKDEAAEHLIEEAQDHQKWQTTSSLNQEFGQRECATQEFQQSGTSMTTA